MTTRLWPHQDSGTWVVILWQQATLKTSLRAVHVLRFVQRAELMNERAEGPHERSITVEVRGLLGARPSVFYPVLLCTPCIWVALFQDKVSGLSTRCVQFLWQYGGIISLYSKHRCMYSRSTLFSVRCELNTYNIMWVDICLAKAGVRT